MMAENPLLALEDVDAGYGPFKAIFGISLEIAPGQAVAMLGANGAGKTTVARVCSGLIKPTAGKVLLDGRDVSGDPAYRLARAGVAHAPEGRSVFATLSVEENLALSFREHMGRNGFRAAIDHACELFPRLGERRKQLAGTLSGGEQRMLALARVLVQSPRLLVADELSLGLAPLTVEEVYRTLATIKAEGTSILVIEQHVHHALALADEAVVLRHGEIVHRGSATEVAEIGDQLLPRAEAAAARLAAGETESPSLLGSSEGGSDIDGEAGGGTEPPAGPARRRAHPLMAASRSSRSRGPDGRGDG